MLRSKIVLSFLCLFAVAKINAQYFYNDVLGTQQANQQYKQLISNQLRKVTAVSYEGNNELSKDFGLEQTIDNEHQLVVTKSKSIANGVSYFSSYFKGNKVYKTVDSNQNAINTVLYEYDNQGKVKAITSTNKDFDGTLISTETHLWSYNTTGQPELMTKIKNGTDSTIVTFNYDEAGNVAEEAWKKNNRIVETYYYYYNDKQKLTDIVRFNKKAKRMLPDFIMDYDEKGRVSEMRQTQSASANYLTWKYQYNPQGLKERELVFNKQKELLGKIEYKYE